MYIIRTILLRCETVMVKKTFFNFFLNIQIESFVLLSERGTLFHLVDDAELNVVLSYLMQWVIGWCSLIELILRKSLVFVLSFIMFRKL